MMRLFYILLFLVCFHTVAQAQAPTRLGVPTPLNGIATVGDPAAQSNAVPLPVTTAGSSFMNIDTNDDTTIKSNPSTLTGLIVNTAGTNSTATIYDGTCSGTKIATVSTAAQTTLSFGGITAMNGICVTTVGDVAADITIIYR